MAAQLKELSLQELQSELKKRERRVGTLKRQRAKLFDQIAKIDAEITGLGGTAGSDSARVRPRNENNLADALVQLLKNKTLGVSEAADEVQKAGYRTTSPNFRTIVNQTLLKDKRFKRVGRGQYTASASASAGGKKKRRRTKRS